MSAVIHPDLPGGRSANKPFVTEEVTDTVAGAVANAVNDTVTDEPETVPVSAPRPSAAWRRRKRQHATADNVRGGPLPHESLTLFWGGSYGTRII